MAAFALWSPVAAAGDPPTELSLVRHAVDQPWLASRLSAGAARVHADRTAPPWLADPDLLARREQANGPAGANTRVLGGGVSVDLGASGWSRRASSRELGQAAERALRADLVAAVCDLRRGAVRFVASQGRVRAGEVLDQRLNTLRRHLDKTSDAGLASGFDRDRLRLVVQTHRSEARADLASMADAEAWLQVRTGQDPGGLVLSPARGLKPLAVWLERGLAQDPTLAMLRSEVNAARARLSAERRGAAPDLDLQAAARWDAMPDGSRREVGWEVGGALQLPIFDRGRQGRRRADAELEAARAAEQERAVVLRTQIQAAWSRAEIWARTADLAPSVDLWDGAVQRYLAGEGTLSELLDVAFEAERAELARVQSDAAMRRARLDLACAAGWFDEPEFNHIVDEVAP